ncbi:hypothetical protein acsn021_16430 [Anaerocolumna cellulosilytica]|uniref:Uncharacterized protein n=1 Tax=Anaerocolumna cellulosilytica TaxID=433286 RepID=A0A6S6QTW9_9FIRM|nr:flavodoxin family protein [Anaerocolumna cellulosilytica]MBB5197266.1 multimeric flavodoxin WrbA [Anaerocolumna cellulosilytica]BCJ94074.1 hypothetical protein acsn021_16430 [Anaerocolumna cellulosilytica]
MRMIIHDLDGTVLNKISKSAGEDIVITDDGSLHPCIGCFGCWIKTPAVCVIRDKYQNMGELISKCEEVIIISKCCYGGYSPVVKNVLDRSISYIHPYFRIVNKEMHHKQRYQRSFQLRVIFYGEDMTDNEKKTAKYLVRANSLNLSCQVKEVLFCKNPLELEVV